MPPVTGDGETRSASPTVQVERRGRIQVITLRREEKRNAIDSTVTAGIDNALNEFEDDPDLWCSVLTGGSAVFSAGADLRTGPGEPTPRGGIAGITHRVRTKPLIAAVEGWALGGGLELVLCCDLVVASRAARFGLPEPKRGLLAAFGGVFRIAQALPPNVARELLLTGHDLDAERAERLGLVNVLCEPGQALDKATALAEEICANAPVAVRSGLAVINAELARHDAENWARSDEARARVAASRDRIEGLTAFAEKRTPHWTGE